MADKTGSQAVDMQGDKLRHTDLRRKYRHLKWKILSKLSYWYDGIIVGDVQGKKMFLDLSDRVHCETLYTTGMWEKNETRVFKKLLRSGMVVLDIGANVGYYTLLAAEAVGASGRVYAFEPEPSRFRLLEKNIQANGLKNVSPVSKAISNKTGTARLYLNPRKNPADHRLFDSSDHRESIDVETTRIDDFFKDQVRPIHVIKMDIQGSEVAALEGMRETIRRNKELVIITEFWPEGLRKGGFSPSEFLGTLVAEGFALQIISEGPQALQRVEPEEVLQMCATEMYLICQK